LILPTKLFFTDLLKHHVRSESGIDHGAVFSAWMHPPAHRILGFVSRSSSLSHLREVWRLNQLKGINQQEIFVKGICSTSDNQTIERFPTLYNANIFNKSGQKLGLIADFIFETENGKIQYYLVSRSNPLIPGTSRWRLSLSQIIDKQPGSISCAIDTFEDLPIHKASLREEFLSKSRKWKTQFEDFTYKASDKLEGWIDDQLTENAEDIGSDNYISENKFDLQDDWVDDSDIDSFEEFNRMNKFNKKTSSRNESDLDPWI